MIAMKTRCFVCAAVPLYAKWTPNTYSVTYNAKGAASGTVSANQTKTHHVRLTRALDQPGLAVTVKNGATRLALFARPKDHLLAGARLLGAVQCRYERLDDQCDHAEPARGCDGSYGPRSGQRAVSGHRAGQRRRPRAGAKFFRVGVVGN
jgi:hypothetical protein